MDIGQAVRRLQSGDRVAREGWNGKNMYLVLVPGSEFVVAEDKPFGMADRDLVGKQVKYRPHVDMFTTQGDFVPWVCSQSDLLANDWEIYDG
jgi:hypothetical protein